MNNITTWAELSKLEEPFNFQELLSSSLLAAKRNETETASLIRRVSASVSTVASALLILHIIRSHVGFSKTYHRLVLGLSISDLLSSLMNILASMMVPKELSYFVRGAMGNTATCTAQGFLLKVGNISGNLYNCSICFYYLAIIRYNKKDAYIRQKLEPWLHFIPILLTLTSCIIDLALDGYNYGHTVCFSKPNKPPHCIGYETGHIRDDLNFTIPCGRGDRGNNVMYKLNHWLSWAALLTATPIVILWTMMLMFMSVSKVQSRLRRYGAASLGFSSGLKGRREKKTPISADDNVDDIETSKGESGKARTTDQDDEGTADRGRLKKKMQTLITRFRPQRGANNTGRRGAGSQKAAVFYMAIGYASAWTIVWMPVLLYHFVNQSASIALMDDIFSPLQGLFNFLVFFSPKVRSSKKSKRGQEEGWNWWQAFVYAYNSKGPQKRSTTLRSTNHKA